MFVYYPVENTNPSLGPVQNGKQPISVYDVKLGNTRTFFATPNECDEFISSRQNIKKENSKRTIKTMLLSSIIGAGLGSGIGAIDGKLVTNTINENVERMNAELASGKKQLHNLEVPYISSFSFNELYDKATKTYKKMGSAKIKENAIIGGMAGVFSLLILGFLNSESKNAKALIKLDRAFIDEHSKVK